MKSIKRYFPILAVKIAVLVLISETAIMIFIGQLGIGSAFLETLVDSLLLMAITTPFLLRWALAAEKRLAESEEKFRTITERSVTGVYLVQDGLFRYVNPRAAEMFGYTVDEVVGKKGPKDVVDPEDWPLVMENLKKRLSGEVQALNYNFRGRKKDGGLLHAEVYGVTTVYDGKPAVIGTMLDITGRKKVEAEIHKLNSELEERVERRTAELQSAQDRLIQSEKMSAVGQLAAGVAHEINNPLGIILGFAQGLAKRVKEDDGMCMPLRSIEREALRCKNLVQDLLVFSRSSKLEEEDLDLNETLAASLSLIAARAKTQGIEILRELAPGLPAIPANKNKIQQVLINLANNAIDAMPKGGTLAIGTALSARAGYVEIRVRDTGHGIPKEIRTRIMEPFFTTKEAGKGTGLGLALVYEIIEKHNGSLELESGEGKGTEFIVYLPVQAVKPPVVRP